jgi:prepilin signal peptidase PulO-like enzyme (type II secretory pathway)
VYYGVFLGFILAAVASLGMLLLRRLGRKDEIPMGPFLATGTLAVFIGMVATG